MPVTKSSTHRMLVIGTMMLGLAACQTAPDASSRLTADEVRSTFVDRPWSQGSGEFLFERSGKYRYADSKFKAHGTYVIAKDGVLCTTNDAVGGGAPNRRTCYTFYREGNGYKYYHDRSGKYWPAHLK